MSDIVLRPMNRVDIALALQLSGQNGWNRLQADWQRQLDLEPAGCLSAVDGSRLVGTACACVFETIAWVNLVLVDDAYRGRGIGTRLTERVVAYLDERGVPSQRLDATPLGRPIYEKLGFVAEYELVRYAGTLPGSPDPKARVRLESVSSHDLEAFVRLDHEITRTPRRRLFAHLVSETPYSLLMIPC